jgi:hypothetical protein
MIPGLARANIHECGGSDWRFNIAAHERRRPGFGPAGGISTEPPNSLARTGTLGGVEYVQMTVQELVAWMELKRHLMKFSGAIAAVLRGLELPPEQPIKRRPF